MNVVTTPSSKVMRELEAQQQQVIPHVPQVSVQRLLDFSTLFCQWMLRGDDVVVQLFPRGGPSDLWSDGHYVERCRNCRAEVRREGKDYQACSRCGKRGLLYVAGRLEQGSRLRFPDDIEKVAFDAVNRLWEGSVAILREDGKGAFFDRDGNPVPAPMQVLGLGALLLQLQGAASLRADDVENLVDRLCELIDGALERR